MFRIHFDNDRQLVSFHFSQHVVPQELEQELGNVRNKMEKMTPGFRMLTDLSELTAMDPACASYVGQIMDICKEKGIKRVVRVIPDPHKDIGFTLMSRFHYGDEVAVQTCETLQEALESLDAEFEA